MAEKPGLTAHLDQGDAEARFVARKLNTLYEGLSAPGDKTREFVEQVVMRCAESMFGVEVIVETTEPDV